MRREFDPSEAGRRVVTQEDIDRALEVLELHDSDAANMLRNYIRGLEARALAGELLEEEEGWDESG